jgi:hypothetical protein
MWLDGGCRDGPMMHQLTMVPSRRSLLIAPDRKRPLAPKRHNDPLPVEAGRAASWLSEWALHEYLQVGIVLVAGSAVLISLVSAGFKGPHQVAVVGCQAGSKLKDTCSQQEGWYVCMYSTYSTVQCSTYMVRLGGPFVA